MYSTFGFATNGLVALLATLVIFPISYFSKFFVKENIDGTDLRNQIAIVTGGNTGPRGE
jgi:hypothetical protein